jgi:hypothetical protein
MTGAAPIPAASSDRIKTTREDDSGRTYRYLGDP